LAITCKIKTWHPEASPQYYRLHEVEIFFNNAPPPDWSWWYGGGEPPSSDQFMFQGLLVHELGHSVRLEDLACTPGDTMCGGMTSDGSYFARTLQTDDILAANEIYPCC
jgi:hypothetical protein